MGNLLIDKLERTTSADQCADAIMDTVPLVMRAIRAEMRRHRPLDLSVLQFRALGFVRRNPGVSLSHVASYIGLTLPSTSKMIDGMVERGLVVREASTDDRRRITLRLSAAGQQVVNDAHRVTQRHIAETIAPLSGEQRNAVSQAMHLLRPLFTSDELDTLAVTEDNKEE